MDIAEVVTSFAQGIQLADARRPVAVNSRSGVPYQPGIGPHTESQTTRLAVEEVLNTLLPLSFEVPYPSMPRAKCDLCFGDPLEWAVEIKMLRLMGDNGKLNDNMLMHILSPYPAHRSAVTDCVKLADSGFEARKGVVIFGYDYDAWPMDPAVDSFEALGSRTSNLSERACASFEGLVHPVHQRGRVFGWELLA
jgi:hypothetical protein